MAVPAAALLGDLLDDAAWLPSSPFTDAIAVDDHAAAAALHRLLVEPMLYLPPPLRKRPRAPPSRFCHMCARTQKSRKVVCGNIASGACRKAVCELCFAEHGWDFAAAENQDWRCPHCQGLCADVPRARCHIYNKTNERRKSARGRNARMRPSRQGE